MNILKCESKVWAGRGDITNFVKYKVPLNILKNITVLLTWFYLWNMFQLTPRRGGEGVGSTVRKRIAKFLMFNFLPITLLGYCWLKIMQFLVWYTNHQIMIAGRRSIWYPQKCFCCCFWKAINPTKWIPCQYNIY